MRCSRVYWVWSRSSELTRELLLFKNDIYMILSFLNEKTMTHT